MTVPTDLKYTDSHEWARLDADGTVTVGITHHAQDRLGDLVYVENPAVGKRFQKGQECGVVESVKAASDIYAPVSGEVVAINEAAGGQPGEESTRTPMRPGCSSSSRATPAELGSLLDAAAYQKLVDRIEARVRSHWMSPCSGLHPWLHTPDGSHATASHPPPPAMLDAPMRPRHRRQRSIDVCSTRFPPACGPRG